MKPTPSGRQVEIASGRFRATAVEVGGGIRALTADGHDVLDGYPDDAMCDGARGTPLVPWPNRLEDGRYTFDGAEHQVALTEPERHNAIHGFGRWRSWQVREQRDDAVTVGLVLHPLPGYPHTLDVAVEYVLDDTGLVVRTSAANLGDRPCPYAYGQHPYLTAGTDFVDACLLELNASHWLPTDDRGLPTGVRPVAGTDHDFREPRPLGGSRIDHAFTELARDGQGRAWARLTSPDGRSVGLWVDEHYAYLEVFTGDTLAPDRRRRGLGVEPMTCAPNGFRSGAGLVVLEPGEALTTTWGITA